MRTNAGSLNRRIRFDRRAVASDGYGNEETGWQTLIAGRWARIRPVRGSEDVLADRVQGIVTYEITVRSDSETKTVCAGDRIVNLHTNETYNIHAIVNPDERGGRLVMTCQAGGADG